jgi:hypothetical protein
LKAAKTATGLISHIHIFFYRGCSYNSELVRKGVDQSPYKLRKRLYLNKLEAFSFAEDIFCDPVKLSNNLPLSSAVT